MEDTTKEKKVKEKKSANRNKNKNNHEPKWKSKKTGMVKEPVKKVTKKKVSVPKKEEVKEEKHVSINKKESGKKVDKQRLIDKYNIEKTISFELPTKEEMDKIYSDMSKESSEPKKIKRRHYNYLSRISTLVVMILIFLVLCILFVFKAIDYQLGGSTTYSEYTSDDYYVCSEEDSVDRKNCQAKDLEYNVNDVSKIHAIFNYEAVYSKNILLDAKYYVDSTIRIYDKQNQDAINYNEVSKIIDSTPIKVEGKVINFSTDLDINFNKYRDFASQYIKEENLNSKADLEISLVLVEGEEERKLSSITIPLTEDKFMITSNNLDNQNQLVVSNNNKKEIDPFYIFIAIICLLMDILLFTYLANFIYMVKNLDNKYNKTLKHILREYDEFIVNTTSTYNIPEGTQVVKVESFDELLDARNTLEKPIVYEKINNSKSKFYVEDNNTIFVYTMKDEGE